MIYFFYIYHKSQGNVDKLNIYIYILSTWAMGTLPSLNRQERSIVPLPCVSIMLQLVVDDFFSADLKFQQILAGSLIQRSLNGTHFGGIKLDTNLWVKF